MKSITQSRNRTGGKQSGEDHVFSLGVWPTITLAVGLVMISLVMVSQVKAAADPEPPQLLFDAITVGVVLDDGDEETVRALSELILLELSANRLKHEQISTSSDDFSAYLDDNSDLDVLIKNTVVDGNSPAFISYVYIRGKNRATKLKSSDLEALAVAVVAHILDFDTISTLVQQKEEIARAILELDEDDPEGLDLLGLIYYARSQENPDNLDLAIQAFERAIEVDPLRSGTHYNLYLCYRQKGDVEKQIEHLNAAIQADTNNENAKIGLANLSLGEGDYAKAISIYRSLLTSPITGSEARYNLALSYMRTGENEEAWDVLQEVPDWDPLYEDAQQLIYTLEQRLDQTGSPEPTVVHQETGTSEIAGAQAEIPANNLGQPSSGNQTLQVALLAILLTLGVLSGVFFMRRRSISPLSTVLESATGYKNHEEQTKLYRILSSDRVALKDLQDLAFNVNIDWENLEGDTKREKARSMVKYLAQRNKLDEAYETLFVERPDLAEQR